MVKLHRQKRGPKQITTPSAPKSPSPPKSPPRSPLKSPPRSPPKSTTPRRNHKAQTALTKRISDMRLWELLAEEPLHVPTKADLHRQKVMAKRLQYFRELNGFEAYHHKPSEAEKRLRGDKRLGPWRASKPSKLRNVWTMVWEEMGDGSVVSSGSSQSGEGEESGGSGSSAGSRSEGED